MDYLSYSFGLFYFLESGYYSDFGCGCSSACTGFYVSTASKVVGYLILLTSALLIIYLRKKNQLSGILALMLFVGIILFVTYGNGFMLFNKGACGQSLNQTTFYLTQKPIGDFAKSNGESLQLDSLGTGYYSGKLLGYLVKDGRLTVYRIDADPLQVPTGFLFWQIDLETLTNNFRYGLVSYRIPPDSLSQKTIELIGGKNMPEEAFLSELERSKEFSMNDIFNPILTYNLNGTTTYRFKIQ
ncbi:MAG: hypothetical protein IPG39_03410 [Bacteroidetes bacterium]|nr:hypothetical protein [Bacteroidota bacterium]